MNSIAKIQKKLVEKELAAILITDEKNQRYATGFAFTDGAVIVAREKAWLLTDSRYIEAAENTVDGCVTVQMFDRQHSKLSLMTAALREAKVSRLGAEEQKLNHGEYLALEKELTARAKQQIEDGEQALAELLALVLETASGRQTCSERMGCREIALFKDGVTL